MKEKNTFTQSESMGYYKLLGEKYPNARNALSEAMLLSASLKLPKPTEHFLSDIHGEYNAFTHVLRNASGVIRRYIGELFPHKSAQEQQELATILYYPEKKLAHLKETLSKEEYQNRLALALSDAIIVAKRVATKYDHRIIYDVLPEDTRPVLDSLLLEEKEFRHKGRYVSELLDQILESNQGEKYIQDIANLTSRFAIENLHVIGDIYDRGDEAEKVMDFLMDHPGVDIQWGNHDIAWVGAASGSHALIANVLRIATRYNELDTLEDGYGINLMPLVQFSMDVYKVSSAFLPKVPDSSQDRNELLAKMHKALAILQFKAEGQIIQRNPSFQLDHMLLMDKIDWDDKTATIEYNGMRYPLLDDYFPTVDPLNPFAYTPKEKEVMDRLTKSFLSSQRLQKHIRFLVDRGAMYKISNGNLLFHGCIPMTEHGEFRTTDFTGEVLSGKKLLDSLSETVRSAFYEKRPKLREWSQDLLFYLWCGKDSPLFGKDLITTFNRYFIENKETHIENKDPYYRHREKEDIALKILEEFGIQDPRGMIVNGHTPVKKIKGESPIKANGKVVVIDGGFAPAYRKSTGTAGYTLISNSYGLLLATHTPLPGEEPLIQENLDITSSLEFILEYDHRRLAEDTDKGKEIKKYIEDLKFLASLYEDGRLTEK